jgi:hypothetical protein
MEINGANGINGVRINGVRPRIRAAGLPRSSNQHGLPQTQSITLIVQSQLSCKNCGLICIIDPLSKTNFSPGVHPMPIVDYFQAPKCPVCKTKIPKQKNLLASQKIFSSKPVPAGQCHECKADLQWVRSWQKALILSAVGVVLCSLFLYIFSVIKDEGLLKMFHVSGMSIAIGFASSKELSVTNPR